MKKKLNVLIIIILLFSIFTRVKADTGWDGDYDYGGGSYSDYGGSWSYGYDYGSSSDYSDYGSGISISAPIAIVLFIIIVIPAIINTIKKGANYRPNISPLSNTTMYKIMTEEEIKSVLKDFNMEEFKSTVFEIYKNLQIAWMNFDYETLRKYTTDELYNMYHSQLVALSIKKQKNIMKDFTLESMDIVGMEQNDKSVSLKVRAAIRCYDYVVDENENVVRGNSLAKVIYNYEMTFVKGLGTKNNKCPNCNAPLDNNRSSVCPYCESIIISDNYDWILSKKEVKSQTANKKR